MFSQLRFLLLIMLALSSVFEVGAEPITSVKSYMQQQQIVGKAKLTYLFWDVYETTLYAPTGIYSGTAPFTLKLTYLRDFEGSDIAQRSITEMQKQGLTDQQKMLRWADAMQSIFPDVTEGQSIIGVAHESGKAVFFLNEDKIGEIDDAEFTTRFFDIWLSENTSEPKVRQQLLNIRG